MATRAISDHRVAGATGEVVIRALDEPGAGGACHSYVIFWGPPDDAGDPNRLMACQVRFQNGPIGEVGVNGVTQEALLAIVIDRLRSFQAGPFACRANAMALTKCEEALMWLHLRTKDRMLRGVEGQTKA